MFKLSRTEIKNLATDATTYSRGLSYYKEGRVKSFKADALEGLYSFDVQGNQVYNVTIRDRKDCSIDHNCNCPASIKSKGACKHVVAALVYLMKRQERMRLKNELTAEDLRAYKVIEYFNDVNDINLKASIFHVTPEFVIDKMLKTDEDRAIMILHAGDDKLYKLQSLKKFISDYLTGENILLGRDFKFVAGESEFDRSSKKIIDIIASLYDIQNISDSKMFVKAQMFMTQRIFQRILENMNDMDFTLKLYGHTYEKVRYIKGNPHIKYDLDAYDDAIVLNVHGKDPIIPITNNGELLFCNGNLYRPKPDFIKNFLPLFLTFADKKGEIVFRNDLMNSFLTNVLPHLHDTMDIEIPESIRSRYIEPELNYAIYLDKYEKAVKLELRFIYGSYEFNCFEEPKTDPYVILRKKGEEDEFMQTIENMGFEPHSGFYLLKNDELIFDFLQEGIESIRDKCKIYYSKTFNKIDIKKSSAFSVGLSVKGNLDLLEMNLSYGDITSDELKELLRSYRLKKKYYRLKDGSFLDLSNREIAEISELLDNLDVSIRTMEPDRITLKRNSAFYLNEVLKDQNIVVKKDEGFENLINNIINYSDGDYKLPTGINGDPRPYQVTGYRWLRSLADNYLGGILADDMGLGKTLQSIMYINSLITEKKAVGMFMIVCPTSLIYNWMDEFENFAPKLKCVVVTGMPEEREKAIKSGKAQVIITSYPLIRRDIELYKNINFDTVFIDEAQNIKNAASQNAQSVKQLRCAHRFALTGTPIENSLSELWSIFDFVMPGYLMSHSKFVDTYEKYIVSANKDQEIADQAMKNLGKRIHPFIMRRMKKEVLTELPDKVEEKKLCELSDDQKKVYLAYMSDLKNEINANVKENGFEKSRLKILAALTRLRQICCHPATFIDNYKGDSGKLDMLMELLPDCISNGHRVLVFSQFTSMLAIIEKKLKEAGYSYFILQGDTPVDVRHEYVDRFNKGEGQVFLVSLKAGGTGLNLVGADTVIHYDPWWNPAVEDQATDRVYRIGQDRNVHVMKIITRGTIEEKIFKLQARKKELSDNVITSGEVFISKLSQADIEEIFS